MTPEHVAAAYRDALDGIGDWVPAKERFARAVDLGEVAAGLCRVLLWRPDTDIDAGRIAASLGSVALDLIGRGAPTLLDHEYALVGTWRCPVCKGLCSGCQADPVDRRDATCTACDDLDCAACGGPALLCPSSDHHRLAGAWIKVRACDRQVEPHDGPEQFL